MNMIKFYLIIISTFLLNATFAQKGLGYKIVNVNEFYTIINEQNNEIIIDTRGDGAFENKHILGAINIANMDALKTFCDTLDKDTPLMVYCDVGTKSRFVCKQLADRDFVSVYNLKGGFAKWKKAEFPIEGN